METAIYSFVGIFFGALLQYVFSKHLDSQKHQRDLRTQAYTDYLKAVCDTALTVQPQSNEGREVRARMANSKSRICLYGSEDVVAKLASFERLGAKLNDNEQRKSFSTMVSAMRKDSKGKSLSTTQDLEVILMGRG